ncbi:acidic mammalian chitinase [Patella vulgata]|uniref:acidic mammalian chitinase n=1 Tax=Patella vulgata TaxID=6465 RepID=UPI00217F664B|nr:acidic mammalian chitinase [Patella vulgata]
MYKRFTDLKIKNPRLKVMLSVGGWSMNSTLFHNAVAIEATRTTAANNIVTFLRSHNFDGIDIDWEFPGSRGSPPEDVHKFTQYVIAIRNAFDRDGVESDKPTLQLSAAFGPRLESINDTYEVPEVTRYFDFINLMFYELHGTWDNIAKHHAPLFGSSNDGDGLVIDTLINGWIKMGVTKNKLVLGVPFYGKTYKLADASKSGEGAVITGPGEAGSITKQSGTLSYQEICLKINQGAVVKRLTGQSAPYLVDGDTWIGFDDQQSLIEKMRYIVKHGYGGAMIWAIDMDDFNGVCGGETFPLLKAMYRSLLGGLIG